MTSVAFQNTNTQTFPSLGFTKQNSHEQGPSPHTIPDPQKQNKMLWRQKAFPDVCFEMKESACAEQKLRATCPASDDFVFRGNARMLRMEE